MSQMAFHFDPTPSYAMENFLQGDNNRAAWDAIHAWPEWPVPVLMLVGPVGVGKTHLSKIWQKRAGALECSAREFRDDFNPTRFAARPVAVDDAHRVAGNLGAERALFHLYNLALQNRQTMLLTAEDYPQRWGLLLPDLDSRLRSALVVEIAEPGEELMRQIYMKLFADRQLSVPEPVINWLLARLERSAVTAGHVVAALDHAALEHQKPISIFLARRALGFHDDEEEGGQD